MVRTQQSGRKSTGGTGVRKQLPPRAARTAALLKTVPEPESDSESDASMRSPPSSPPATTTISTAKPADSQQCYSCIDGGLLYVCDKCSRVICSVCVELPTKNISPFLFICPSCHHDWCRARDIAMTYFGLYKPPAGNLDTMKKAFPDQPAKIHGQFSLTYTAKICTDIFIILHFILEGISSLGSPATMVHEYLSSFFHDHQTLIYKEIRFNLADEEDIDNHWEKMSRLADKYSKMENIRLWCFVTSHGDKDRGDIFHTKNFCSTVDWFFENVITMPIATLLKDKKSICFMMVCGGLVFYPESSTALFRVTGSYNFQHLFAFTTKGLIPSLLSTMLVDMAHRVIVLGYHVDVFIKEVIGTSPIAARHTSIIHLKNTGQKIEGMKYVWSHPDMRPWGNPLPSQCDVCFCFRSWGKKVVVAGESISFRCKGKTSGGKPCSKIVTFRKPGDIEQIFSNGWLSFPWS